MARRSKSYSCLLVACMITLATACGGDDEEGDGTQGGGTGGTSGEGSSGTGGTSGEGGADAGQVSGGTGGMMAGTGGMNAGGTGGTAGAGAGGTGGNKPSIMCGETSCTVSDLAVSFGIAPCCTEENECGGLGGQCLALGQEGESDESCPTGVSSGYTLNGCCRPDGQCGLDYSAVGWGCVARADISPYMADDVPFEPVACGDDSDGGI